MRPRIALWATHLPARWVPNAPPGAGGVEVQYDLLARSLAQAGEVVVAVGSAAPGTRPPAGVELVQIKPARGRMPALARNLRAVWQAARAADANLHVQSAAGAGTFAIALRARLTHRRFAYHWASDADLDGRLMSGGWIERWLFRMGRRLAHVELCQTERQMAFLSPRRRRKAILFPNILDPALAWMPPERPGDSVLWVASVKPKAKRPDLFLDLAKALPSRRFVMVGDLRGPPEFQEHFRARLRALPNVDWVGPVARQAMPGQYARARCLVNTSDTEGFPNTFLEAFACGVPVVSLTIDPNGLLGNQGAGLVTGDDPAKLAASVEALFSDTVWQPLRAAALRVAAQHAPRTAVEILYKLLRGEP